MVCGYGVPKRGNMYLLMGQAADDCTASDFLEATPALVSFRLPPNKAARVPVAEQGRTLPRGHRISVTQIRSPQRRHAADVA